LLKDIQPVIPCTGHARNNCILYKLIFVKLENILWHNRTILYYTLSQLHVFTSTPCIVYPLTSLSLLSVCHLIHLHPLLGLSEGWECYKTLKSRPLEFEDELDRNATVHSHVHIYLKYYNDNPTGDLISMMWTTFMYKSTP